VTEAQGVELLALVEKLFTAQRFELVAMGLLLGAVFFIGYQTGRKGGK